MAGEYDINLSNGSVLTTLYPLETSGPDNMSTPRQVLHALPKFEVLPVGQNGSNINTVVVVKGDKTDLFIPGETFRLVGTTGVSSSTVFTVSSDVVPNTTSTGAYYDTSDDVTKIYVGPSSNFGTIPGDGHVQLDVFVLAGDLTYRFVNNFRFTVSQSGGNDGAYTVNYSRLAGKDTVIRIDQVIPGDTLPLGQIQYEIGDNPTVDTDSRTTLKLPGKGTLNYGEMLVENMVRMTENWAGNVPPDDVTSPITQTGTVGQAMIGQYWYNTTPNREGFKFYNGSEWSNDWDIDDGALLFRDAEDADKDIIITASEQSIDHPNWTTPSANDQPGLIVWSAQQKPNGGSIFRVLDQGAGERLDVEYHSDPTLGYIRTINNLKVEGTGDTLIWSDRVAIGAGKMPTFDTTTLTIQGDGISINSDPTENSVLSMNSPTTQESVITLEHNSIVNGRLRQTNDTTKVIELATFNNYDLNLLSSDNVSVFSTNDTTISANNQLTAVARDGRVTVQAIDAGTGATNAGVVEIISATDMSTTVGGNHTETITGTSDTTITGNTTYSVTGTHDTTIVGDTTYNMSGTNYTETINATNITSNMTGTVVNTVNGAYSETFNGNFTSNTVGTSNTTILGDTTHSVTGIMTETVTGNANYTVTGGVYNATFDQAATYDYNDTFTETIVGDSVSSAANYYYTANSFNFTGASTGSPTTADFNVDVDGAINLTAAQGMNTTVDSYNVTTAGDIVLESTSGNIVNNAVNGDFGITSNTFTLTTNTHTAQVNGNSTTTVTGIETHNVGAFDVNSTTTVDLSGTVYNAVFSDAYNVTATNNVTYSTTNFAVTAQNTASITSGNETNITGDNAVNINTTNGSPAGNVNVTTNQFYVNAATNVFDGISTFNDSVQVNSNVSTTNQFLGASGTQLLPTYGFTDYPGTGMYYDTLSDRLSFSVDGTTIFYLDPTDDTLSVSTPNYEDFVTDPNDIPNKQYVDNTVYDYVNSRSWREPVDVKAPNPYTSAAQFPTTGTIDDVAIFTGMRVLFSDVDNLADADIWVFDGVAWNTVPENPRSIGDAVYVKYGSSKSNAFAWSDDDEWAQITGSGGGTFYMYETHTATSGQTVFNLVNPYKKMADGSRLLVFVDGIKYIFNEGYLETSPTVVTMQPPVPFAGGEIVEFYALYETTANARLKHEVLTGFVGNTLIPFSTVAYVPSSDNLLVYLNGQKVIKDNDYVEVSTSSINWIGAPLEATDIIEIYAGITVLSGQELKFIEDVSATPANDGEVLTWNSSLGVWEPRISQGLEDGTPYDEIVGTGASPGVYVTTYVTVQPKITGVAYQQVFVNGVMQMEGKNYTVTGPNQITFALGAEPAAGDDITIFKL